jgi:hypothetical protein
MPGRGDLPEDALPDKWELFVTGEAGSRFETDAATSSPSTIAMY